jgi:hypothetical protein
MLLSLAAMALSSQPTVALADVVPTYDVRATCGAEAQADPTAGIAAVCMAEEQRARETLVGQWAQFSQESRTRCVQTEAGSSGIRSYVELLTCLQIAKDVKNLPKQ